MLDDKIKIKVIEECVKQFEKRASTEPRYGQQEKDYEDCLKRMRKADLQNITRKQIEIIRRFLYKWGGMGRVLARRKYRGWENKLMNLIKKHSGKLEKFRKMRLINLDFTIFEKELKDIIKQFRDVLGEIATAKVLHLICPDVFPLWDTAIRKEFYDKDYYQFMQEMQKFVKDYDKLLSKLANQYKKNELKVLDEFLWWMANKPLSLIFNEKRKLVSVFPLNLLHTFLYASRMAHRPF